MQIGVLPLQFFLLVTQLAQLLVGLTLLRFGCALRVELVLLEYAQAVAQAEQCVHRQISWQHPRHLARHPAP